jgi:hypothetical protein
MYDASPTDHFAKSCRSNERNLELYRGGELAGVQGDGHQRTHCLIEHFSDETTSYASSRVETFWFRLELNGDGPKLDVYLDASPSEESETRGPRQTIADKVPEWITSLPSVACSGFVRRLLLSRKFFELHSLILVGT